MHISDIPEVSSGVKPESTAAKNVILPVPVVGGQENKLFFFRFCACLKQNKRILRCRSSGQFTPMSIIQVTGSGVSAGADRTTFYGVRVPVEIKAMIKPLSKLEKASFRKILQCKCFCSLSHI